METTIHNVNKITLGPVEVRELKESETKYSVRNIRIESSDEGILIVACFGNSKEDLQIETEISAETKKIKI